MVIEFNREEDEQCCTAPGVARISYGLANEKKLLKVINVINSAASLADVKAIYPRTHWLEGNRFWQVGVPLADGRRLVVEPLAYTTRNWREIEAIKFIEITDYHK